jgi:hypothetical protein
VGVNAVKPCNSRGLESSDPAIARRSTQPNNTGIQMRVNLSKRTPPNDESTTYSTLPK